MSRFDFAEHASEDLPAFALGALGPDELDRAAGHLSTGCGACTGELAKYQRVASELVLAIALSSPSASLRPRLMTRLGPSPRRERRAVSWPVLALAASLALAVSLGAFWLQARREADALTARLSGTQHDSMLLVTKLQKRERETAWLRDPRVQVALLKGLAGAEGAKARLLFNPATKGAVLYVNGLPPLALEKSYELWAFVDGVPRPAGVFDAKNGAAVVSLAELPAGGAKFAVSVEPRGGVNAPTGAVVLLGETL